MARYNLLTEPWIVVMRADSGATEAVSMLDLFKNAHKYSRLAGDTKTQDFAVFRVLLAALHTVFSRFNAEGAEYGFCTLDEKYKPLSDIDEYYADDYEECLYETWINLWSRGSFPDIVGEYLLKWHDSFYLFDDKLPFFQVTAEDIEPAKISMANATPFFGKNINRLISESCNTASLFSPKYEYKDNKEMLIEPQIARWIITLQSYIGTPDKTIFITENGYDISRGWLFDIGGIVLQVVNLFQTLLLNCVAIHSLEKYQCRTQRPCWEYNSVEVLSGLMLEQEIDNLAELYTNWARAIYIDPNIDVSEPFKCQIVKLPRINSNNFFLEPMTLWKFKNDSFIPVKHEATHSLWRSFGLLTLPSDTNKQIKPELISWLGTIREIVYDIDLSIDAISMDDDGNKFSQAPADQIYDTLRVNNFVFSDTDKEGWVERINEVVNTTKYVVDTIYGDFLLSIKIVKIDVDNDKKRSKQNKKKSITIKEHYVEQLYSLIDMPFRRWLANIDYKQSKAEAVLVWYKKLKGIVLAQAFKVFSEANIDDYVWYDKENKKAKGIVVAYNKLKFELERRLPI